MEEINKPSLIHLEGIRKSFGNAKVLDEITLDVKEGEFISLLGPSGCGKSTLLNLITGLQKADEGTVDVAGKIGYMQQKDLLLPWDTVIDNVGLSLVLQGEKTKTARKKARTYFSEFGLSGYEGKYPYEMSGGMRQRASFLRTFLSSDEIMLLDEPFGALDSITRGKLQQWLLEMKEKLKLTILFITHDIEEAALLSDRIYVLSEKPSRIKRELVLSGLPKNRQERLLCRELLDVKKEILELL